MGLRIIGLGLVSLQALGLAHAQNFHVELDEWAQSAHNCTGSILRALDDGYYLELARSDTDLMVRDLQVIRLDCNAQVAWSRTYEIADPNSGGILNSQMLNDRFGNLLLTASAMHVPLVIKLDDQGNVLWCRSRNEAAQVFGAAEAEDGYYVTQGFQGEGNMGPSGAISKLGFDGATLWSKQMYNGYDRLTKVMVLGTGDLIVAGYSQVTEPDTMSGFTLTRLHPDGSLVWSNLYQAEIGVIDMAEDWNGDLVLGGTGYGNNDWGNGLTEMAVVKVHSDGNLNWARGYGGYNYDEGFTIHVGNENNYVLCAEPESFSSQSQASLISTSGGGDFQWMKLYGDTALGSFPFGAVQNADSGYTIFGINAGYWGYAPIYLIRTASDGSSCGQILDTVPGTYTLDFPHVPLGSLTEATPFIDYSVVTETLSLGASTICLTGLGPCDVGLSDSTSPISTVQISYPHGGGISFLLPSHVGEGTQCLMIYTADGKLLFQTSFRGASIVFGLGNAPTAGLYIYRIETHDGLLAAGTFQLMY